MTGKTQRASQEAELIAAVRKGKANSKEEALSVLALMMSAGRVKKPSVVATGHQKDGIAAF